MKAKTSFPVSKRTLTPGLSYGLHNFRKTITKSNSSEKRKGNSLVSLKGGTGFSEDEDIYLYGGWEVGKTHYSPAQSAREGVSSQVHITKTE